MRVLRPLLGFLLISILFGFSSAQAAWTSFEKLEQGQILSRTQGSSFYLQSLLKKDPETLQDILKSKPKELPKIFPQIAFVEPMVSSDGQPLLYLKIRGLGEQGGVLVHVQGMSPVAFENATKIGVASDEFGPKEAAATAPSTPMQVALAQTEIQLANKESDVKRNLEVNAVIRLRGPLQDHIQIPGLRLQMDLAVGTYTKGAQPQAYLFSEVDFAMTAPQSESFNSYFGDRKLNIAKTLGVELVRKLAQ